MLRSLALFSFACVLGMVPTCVCGCTQVIVSPDGTVRYMTVLKDVKLDELTANDGAKSLKLKGYNADETKATKEMVSAAVEAAVKAAKP